MNTVSYLCNINLGYTSPEPEDNSGAKAVDTVDEGDNDKDTDDEDNDSRENPDQDEVDTDVDEPEDKVEPSKGQPEGVVVDIKAMHDTLQLLTTMHDSFQDINMHSSIQPEDPPNLIMHGDSYFIDSTNFHSTGSYSADLNLFSALNYWTPAPVPTG